ncbi:MAG: hypothetical protein K0Q91_2233 [Fibrobacteria bacterium]|nr:hypothetical protein [Fibrobacteria bacterium]
MKTDLYTFVHKAHRLRLFHLSTEIARADPGEPGTIRDLLDQEIGHLRDHAAIEEHYIHPLYRKVDPERAAELEREHRDLEKEIGTLEGLRDAGEWKLLHRAYNGFLGRYLVHLEEEERAQEDILWVRCSDEELAEVFGRFQRERAPEKLRDDLELFLPALSAPELTGMFTGMKLRAPDYVFQFAQGLAEQMTKPAIWAKVRKAIA